MLLKVNAYYISWNIGFAISSVRSAQLLSTPSFLANTRRHFLSQQLVLEHTKATLCFKPIRLTPTDFKFRQSPTLFKKSTTYHVAGASAQVHAQFL
jgi:hypothetical protein